ncbi:MAG TPA: DUF5615 family PIN-like protein [Fimbriimonadaceae bacterium]|nr:DUF5615 family PIN-like protein [Fimbriimonadaceae bacterium]
MEKVKLLFDEMFSHRQIEFVATESRLAEMQHVRRIGWSGQPDTIWIPRAVQKGFVILTGDRNEKTRGYTAADLKQMNARVLLFCQFWDHMTGWERAKWLVARIERLTGLASELAPGSVSLVDRACGARAV